MTAVPSDAQLLARSHGEPRAFDAIFDRHFAEIHRYLRHRCGAEAADDLAAETFVRAFAARLEYLAQHESARAWLYAIATNLIRDEQRRRSRAGALLARLAALAPVAAAPPGDPADPELGRALAALSEDERDALLLSSPGAT